MYLDGKPFSCLPLSPPCLPVLHMWEWERKWDCGGPGRKWEVGLGSEKREEPRRSGTEAPWEREWEDEWGDEVRDGNHIIHREARLHPL